MRMLSISLYLFEGYCIQFFFGRFAESKNGLDNAIEACMRMREKQPDAEAYITIRSFRAKNMYFIEIENSFDGTALFDKDSGFPISTKEDKEVHGIGLKNIRKCAVKYGGDMDCIVKGNKFILSVMVKS